MGSKVIVSGQVSGAILAVLPKFIGDAINTLPALELLQNLYPTQRIYVLGRPFMASLFSRADHYGVEFIPDKRHYYDAPHNILSMSRILKGYNISAAVLFRGSLRDALLMKLAGIKTIIGYAQNARSPLLSHALKLNPCEHYIYRYCQLVNEPHGKPFETFNKPTLTPQKLEQPLKGKLKIALYLGGTIKGHRCYPHDLSLALLKRLSAYQDIHLYLLGDSAERDEMETLTQELVKQNKSVTNLAGRMTLDILVDTIGNMDAMISIDSGPMHIAAACNTPCVAIIGQGTSPWSIVAPKQQNLIALHHQSMSLSESQMIRDISPQAISQALFELIK
ncbi:glycosyltransferase family 9 protein [Pseudoalteromonas luteoviolacea]|uniref:Glycosyl transferase family 9 n=1 Tax=Pseudoalteromonas luteoviolacea S4054 TaxID=1129367 RepID=A0A0F6A7B8_9GAMM|nr:glycosyltransferase family 9 protein [Pseudoalteromonas luteoviolacea]AOT06771.1 hypothetical protein S4054249_02260 [Pseudoalteromonas luteoviolacea]AOT11689.1 hypothetical protein S40542_02260 [Pseudoalteromonas luteoviolacea]AOT16601.1 hypothetical protein S4054_02260 [Pseudoalteromonas luteoviolacea]KKE82122.1 hypothetical protein N479_19595 [Pseudoalteromonas luteoviolacea S4054]KZN74128.1 hypothetical protein N481_10475 [Pseudoalteromonas luteoviolacea S4047-1]